MNTEGNGEVLIQEQYFIIRQAFIIFRNIALQTI